jgi:dihydrolipoamide dehydrogenase
LKLTAARRQQRSHSRIERRAEVADRDGRGAVGVEFASVYSRFGAETTIVELLPRLVPLEDEEVSKELEKSFRKRGIKSQVDTKLEKLEKTETGVRVTGKTSKGEAVSLEAEMLLVAVGRMPYTKDSDSKARRSKSKRFHSG